MIDTTLPNRGQKYASTVMISSGRHSREVGNKHARAVIRRLLQLLRLLLHRHCHSLSRLLLSILLSSLRILRRLLGLRGVDDLILQQGVVSVAAANYR